MFFCSSSWVASPALPSAAQLSSRLQPVPLHYGCCSWLPSHSTGISKNTGIFCCNFAIFSPTASHRLSSGSPASITLHDPFSPGPSIASELHPHQHCFLASHSAKPQPFSVTPSYLQNQHRLSDFFTSKFGCRHEVQSWLPLEQSFCVLILRKDFPDFTLVMLVSS